MKFDSHIVKWRKPMFWVLLLMYIGLYFYFFVKIPLFFGIGNPFVVSKKVGIYMSVALGVLGYLVFKISSVTILREFSVKILLCGLFLCALLVGPIQSTDVYWNISHAYNFLHGYNPYLQTLAETPASDYSVYAEWPYVPMTHGPLSVLLYSLPLTLGLPAEHTFVVLRFVWLIPISIIMFYISKLLSDNTAPDANVYETKLAAFLFSAPVLVLGLVDLHNDVFVMFSIFMSYYFLVQKKHEFAMYALVFGFLVKYVTILFFPLILWDWLRDYRGDLRTLIFRVAKCGLGCVVFMVACYLPFLLGNWDLFGLLQGVGFQLSYATYINHMAQGMLVLLKYAIGISGHISLAVFPFSILLSILLWEKNKRYEAFILPMILLIASSSWVTPWYYLWILPFLFMRYESLYLVIFFALLLHFNYGIYTNTYLFLFVVVQLLGAKFPNYLRKNNFSIPLSIKPKSVQ